MSFSPQFKAVVIPSVASTCRAVEVYSDKFGLGVDNRWVVSE